MHGKDTSSYAKIIDVRSEMNSQKDTEEELKDPDSDASKEEAKE